MLLLLLLRSAGYLTADGDSFGNWLPCSDDCFYNLSRGLYLVHFISKQMQPIIIVTFKYPIQNIILIAKAKHYSEVFRKIISIF